MNVSGKKIQEGMLEQDGVAQANTEVVRRFSMCNKPGTPLVWQGKKRKTPFLPQEIAKPQRHQKEEERSNCTFTKSSGIVGN